MAYDAIKWVYVQDMRRWSEEYLLISMDLYNVSYCNGCYWGTINTRVAKETGYDAKEFRFHFFVARDIASGEEIIYNYRDFVISSG